jgi:hypothetical protein
MTFAISLEPCVSFPCSQEPVSISLRHPNPAQIHIMEGATGVFMLLNSTKAKCWDLKLPSLQSHVKLHVTVLEGRRMQSQTRHASRRLQLIVSDLINATLSSISDSAKWLFLSGIEPSPLLLRPFVILLYQPWMIDGDYDYGDIGGMNKWQGNRITLSKPAPVSLCPPQIPHDLSRSRTQAVGSR